MAVDAECHVQENYKSLLSLLCVSDLSEKKQISYQICIILICSVSILVLCWLFYKSVQKYKDIRNPGVYVAAWDKTYCYWTLRLVNVS